MQGRSAGSYFGSFATLVPQNPEVRHEILKAAQELADENEPARLRQREIASIRNELEAIREEVVGLCRDARSLIFSAFRKYGYNPDEPRVPKRQAGGGEWTRGSLAGRQYAAATPIVINPSSVTGISRIDDTTKELADLLAQVVDKTGPTGLAPWLYGTLIHVRFAATVRGAHIPGVEVEKPFTLPPGFPSSKDRVIADVILRDDAGDIIAIYDVKTGAAGLDDARVRELRAGTRATDDAYVIEISIIRGTISKYNSVARPSFVAADSRDWI